MPTPSISVQGLYSVVGVAYLPQYVQTPGTPSPDIATVQGISGGTPVPISGTVTLGSSVAVTGTFWQAIQPVSSPLAAPIANQVKLTAAGTAQALPSVALVNGVIITALTTNTGTITVGPSGINNTLLGNGNGYPLQAGQSITVSASQLSTIYINGNVTGDAIAYLGN